MKIFNITLDKSFWNEFLIAGIITSIGSLVIYSRQHTKFTFNIIEFFSMLPFVLTMLFMFALSIGIFLNCGEDK